MARTHGDKIDELTRQMTVLSERVDSLRREVDDLGDQFEKFADLSKKNDLGVENLRRDFDGVKALIAQIAVLEHKVEDLRSSGQEWTRRFWMILAPLVAGVLGAVVTYYLGVKR